MLTQRRPLEHSFYIQETANGFVINHTQTNHQLISNDQEPIVHSEVFSVTGGYTELQTFITDLLRDTYAND